MIKEGKNKVTLMEKRSKERTNLEEAVKPALYNFCLLFAAGEAGDNEKNLDNHWKIGWFCSF